MKIALVKGHNSRAPGYRSPHLQESEFPFNGRVADMITVGGSHYVKIFERRWTQRGYSAEIADVYGRVDDWGADASVELHFNAATPQAHGTETLSSGTDGSLDLANVFQTQMLADLMLRDRGVKIRRTGRGALSLWAGQAPAIIVEPFFGSNRGDCSEITDERLAACYEKAIKRL